MKKIVAIVQARMGSERLPGKVLEEIAGHPMLWHVVRRARLVQGVDEVVVASTTDPSDDPIEKLCREVGVICFRGDAFDVLDRFYRAGESVGASILVRITGDCPLVDPAVAGEVVNKLVAEGLDYASNVQSEGYPDGLDVEAFTMAALEGAWRERDSAVEREHVTTKLRTDPGVRRGEVVGPLGHAASAMRWSVDEPADLDLVRAIFERIPTIDFGMKEVLTVLDSDPSLARINNEIVRDEGFYRSLLDEAPVPPMNATLEATGRWLKRGLDAIPSATQTFSKGPSQYVQGVAPAYLERAKGSHVWDVDGNRYIDLPMGLGAVLLGHAFEAVDEAVVGRLRGGVGLSLPHPLEVEVAECLIGLIPCAEMVRFGKNGSDATSGAVRAARALTGRDLVACSGYHGWHDWFVSTTTRAGGVPEAVRRDTVTFPYGDAGALEDLLQKHRGKIAAVVMEPIGVVEPPDGYLASVAEMTRAEGALLVFDEVVTGFRMGLGGAQGYFGVVPDMACFGKALGNGYPISAVVGRREVMGIFDEIFFSFTFGGETVGLAAALATMQVLQKEPVIEHLWNAGRRFKDGLNQLAKGVGVEHRIRCIGAPPRTVITFSDGGGTEDLVLKSLFQQECLKRGVLTNGGHNVSYSHSEADVVSVLRVYATVLRLIASALGEGRVAELLEGPPIQPVFRQP